MKRILNAILTMVAFASCQNNSIAPSVDCSQSDLGFTTAITTTDCGLNTGIIEIIATAGEAPYKYSIDEGTSQDTPVFTGLGAGEYKVKLVDNLGCISEKIVVVANKNGLTVSSTSTISDCGSTNGSIKVTASNGVEPYQFQLDSEPPQASPDFLVGPGIYVILITDNNGCEFVLTQIVRSNTTYGADIQPIMASSCAINGCHDGSNSTLPNFNNLIEIQANASMIKSRTQSRNMPKTGSLTQNQIDLIACWVDDGALEN